MALHQEGNKLEETGMEEESKDGGQKQSSENWRWSQRSFEKTMPIWAIIPIMILGSHVFGD